MMRRICPWALEALFVLCVVLELTSSALGVGNCSSSEWFLVGVGTLVLLGFFALSECRCPFHFALCHLLAIVGLFKNEGRGVARYIYYCLVALLLIMAVAENSMQHQEKTGFVGSKPWSICIVLVSDVLFVLSSGMVT